MSQQKRMVVKRVSVDRYNSEFNELLEPSEILDTYENSIPPVMGEVRKYVQDL